MRIVNENRPFIDSAPYGREIRYILLQYSKYYKMLKNLTDIESCSEFVKFWIFTRGFVGLK